MKKETLRERNSAMHLSRVPKSTFGSRSLYGRTTPSKVDGFIGDPRGNKEAGQTLSAVGHVLPTPSWALPSGDSHTSEDAKDTSLDPASTQDPVKRRRKASFSLQSYTPQSRNKQPRHFGIIVSSYLLENRARISPSTRYGQEVIRYFHNHILPGFKEIQHDIKLIDRGVLRAFFQHYEDTPGLSRNLYTTLSGLFRWALREGILEVNPLTYIQAPKPVASRDVILKDDTLSLLLASEPGPLILSLLLTCQRRNETSNVVSSMIRGDVWEIPEWLTKNRRAHVVPLSPIALQELTKLAGRGRPYKGFSKLLGAVHKRLPPEHRYWTLHDLRRTGASWMASQGVRVEVVEAVLNHAKPGLVRVYQRYEYLKEKREALDKWSEFLLAKLGT